MRGLAAGLLLLAAGCEDAADQPRAAPSSQAGDATPLPPACVDLAARPDPVSAAVAARLCDDLSLSSARARAALLAAGTSSEAAAMVPGLSRHPDLQGLARLAALTAPSATATELPPPGQVVATPVDDRVLAQAALAHRRMWDRDVADEDRTRAAAFLAAVHLQALQQLGQEAPMPPLARLLAGRALHHGRTFCTRYWRRRVAGLERTFAETEVALFEVLRQLEASPHAGDSAELVMERSLVRRYLLRGGPAARIQKVRGDAAGPMELEPLANELHRLIEHGLVDTALEYGIAAATTSGLAAMEALLRETLIQAGRADQTALLERRVATARAASPPPPEQGAGALDHPVDPAWPTDAEVALGLEGLLANTTFPARELAIRLEVELAGRPGATLNLLARAAEPDASEALRAQRPTLRALADAQLDSGHARLAVRSADEPPEGEPAIRRAFAAAALAASLLAPSPSG